MPSNPNIATYISSKDTEKLSCTTCVWFESMTQRHKGHGLCRLNPPVVIPRVESGPTGSGIITKAHTSFPYVRESDWCGEHEPDNTL